MVIAFVAKAYQGRQSGAETRHMATETSVQKPSHGRAASSIMRYRLVQMGSAMKALWVSKWGFEVLVEHNPED